MASLKLVPDMRKLFAKERKPPILHPHPAIEYDDRSTFFYTMITLFANEMKKSNI
jgi:hypothetical protein